MIPLRLHSNDTHTFVRLHLSHLPPRQLGRVLLHAARWDEGSGSAETKEFVIRQLGVVLEGRQMDSSNPPPLDMLFNHITEVGIFLFGYLESDDCILG